MIRTNDLRPCLWMGHGDRRKPRDFIRTEPRCWLCQSGVFCDDLPQNPFLSDSLRGLNRHAGLCRIHHQLLRQVKHDMLTLEWSATIRLCRRVLCGGDAGLLNYGGLKFRQRVCFALNSSTNMGFSGVGDITLQISTLTLTGSSASVLPSDQRCPQSEQWSLHLLECFVRCPLPPSRRHHPVHKV